MLWRLTLKQLSNYYKYGIRFDYERRGWTFKEEEKIKSWEETREEVYTPAELKAQEEALKKQYGKDVKGL